MLHHNIEVNERNAKGTLVAIYAMKVAEAKRDADLKVIKPLYEALEKIQILINDPDCPICKQIQSIARKALEGK